MTTDRGRSFVLRPPAPKAAVQQCTVVVDESTFLIAGGNVVNTLEGANEAYMYTKQDEYVSRRR